MARRSWVQIGGELIEVTPGMEIPQRDSAKHNGLLWNDREYQDMGDPRFNSRSSHREYMRAHGLTTTDDFKETWRTAEKRRVESRQGVDPTRRPALEEAYRKVAAGYKPRIEKE